MANKTMIYASVVAMCGLAVAAGWKLTSRGAYESAAYRVIQRDGKFEIREYPDLVLASTGSRQAPGSDGQFMRLFRYISGENEAKQKVAMTTPVFMEQTDDRESRMGFVVPSAVADSGAPEPTASGVELRQRPAGRFAVIRFNGRLDSHTTQSKLKRLRDWILANDLKEIGPIESAGYDPPWTPGPLRRNELLVRVQ